MFKPLSIEGVDIDPSLVVKARRYHAMQRSQIKDDDMEYFPISCAIEIGTLPILDDPKSPLSNVYFRLGDWVHETFPIDDSERYDVILALSITKWIHLNNGDGGIRHFFRKVYEYLLDGGLFILEHQPISGYQKRAGMNEHMRANFVEMEFFPDEFVPFLVKSVGFELIKTMEQSHSAVGFQRTIHVLKKSQSRSI